MPAWQKGADRYEVMPHSKGGYLDCIVRITTTSERDKAALLALKTGDMISFKATFSGETFMRSLILHDGELVTKGASK
jgi:hypothetical protein